MSRPGRKPQGTKHLEKFAASARARLRMRMILETLAGGRTIPEACRMLGIGEAMFHRIRDEALAASLAALEGKPLGRPRKRDNPSRTTTPLERENAELRLMLEVSQLQAQLGSPPDQRHDPSATEPLHSVEKKGARRQASFRT